MIGPKLKIAILYDIWEDEGANPDRRPNPSRRTERRKTQSPKNAKKKTAKKFLRRSRNLDTSPST